MALEYQIADYKDVAPGLISRRTAIKLLCECVRCHMITDFDAVSSILMAPIVEPETKSGRWLPVDSYTAHGGDQATWEAHGNPIAFYYCSECKGQAYAGEDGESLLTDFCPHCGADLRAKSEVSLQYVPSDDNEVDK